MRGPLAGASKLPRSPVRGSYIPESYGAWERAGWLPEIYLFFQPAGPDLTGFRNAGEIRPT